MRRLHKLFEKASLVLITILVIIGAVIGTVGVGTIIIEYWEKGHYLASVLITLLSLIIVSIVGLVVTE